jgi:UDP:flavonoid glycosyltransferase YjiC (YdhE family)
MKIKVLVATNPGISHLHTMMPVMLALKQAGHEVAVASSQTFRPLVERLGFQSFVAGLDWFEPEVANTFPEIQTLRPEALRYWFIQDLYADIAPHEMAPDLIKICGSWKPDLIVRNDYEFSSCVVAERLGLPCANVGIEVFLPLLAWEDLIGDQLAYLRSAYGLPPYPSVDMLYRHLYLTITPPSYQFPECVLPSHSYALRSLGFDRHGDEELPDWVRKMPDQPTVYATIGTVYKERDIFQAILDGLGGEGVNLIVTLGRNRDTTQFGPQPPNVHIEEYIPQTLLFPYCDMAITSASYSTQISALAHGLPVLSIPIGGTQPFHALRSVELGVGLALTRPGQYEEDLRGKRKDLSPEAVREAVDEILHAPSYRQQARRIQEEVQSLPGPEIAVEVMTRLAMEGTLD